MRVNISLPDDLFKRTKNWLDGRPLSGLLADLLTGYLDANDGKGKWPNNVKHKLNNHK